MDTRTTIYRVIIAHATMTGRAPIVTISCATMAANRTTVPAVIFARVITVGQALTAKT